ncbi:hypothetical protein EWM64_g88 [Hericium alpestre]|uniref:Uncharacterized protein n=1 Tax=Hericium alpestre TaxID=135208 RepID=A0A4Z0AAV8_9AGAM|nr:hypothetical protein EWM64_g88 [Hericium alpestre]
MQSISPVSVSGFPIPKCRQREVADREQRAAIRDARRRAYDLSAEIYPAPTAATLKGRSAAYHQTQPQWAPVLRRQEDHKRVPALHEIVFKADIGIVPGVALVEIMDGYGLDDPTKKITKVPNQEFLFALHWPGEIEDIMKVFRLDAAQLSTTGTIAEWLAKVYSAFFAQEASRLPAHKRWRLCSSSYPGGMRFDQLRLLRLYTLDGRVWHTDMAVSMAAQGKLQSRV